MTAKEYLKEIRRIECMQALKTQERLYLKEKLTSLPSYSHDPKVKQSKPTDPAFINLLARIEEIDREITKSIQELINVRYNIINLIMSIQNTTYMQLLYKRYVEHKTYELIAVEMNYEYQTICNYHAEAILQFQTEYKKV